MYRHCIASFFLVLGSFSPVLADDVESKNSTDTGELRVKFEDAVRIGLQKSRTLELARMDRQMSSEKLMEATSPLLPQITSGFTYTRTLQPSVMFMPNFPGIESPMEISSDNSAKATLEVRQSLFNGSAYASIRAAATAGEMSDEAYRNAESAVLSDISIGLLRCPYFARPAEACRGEHCPLGGVEKGYAGYVPSGGCCRYRYP